MAIDAGMPSAGPWIVRVVVGILAGAKDVKLQEACLLCLAALVKENPSVAAWVGRGWSVDGELHTQASVDGTLSMTFLCSVWATAGSYPQPN